MSKTTYLALLLMITSNLLFSQSIDDCFSQKQMKKDLEIFKKIRLEANSGLYKYRTKRQIDSIYSWADQEIEKSATYRDFYNIVCHLTDFEGSLHNDTSLPGKTYQSLKEEQSGYFPYPIKWIDGNWIINFQNGEIPLGAKIISINKEKIGQVVKNLYKYYTTDGVNTTGKRIGLEYSFGKYYRLNYGLTTSFTVEYKLQNSDKTSYLNLTSLSNKAYYENVRKRYSKPFDEINYKRKAENEIYSYQALDKETGILTINSFSMGNETDPMHLRYVAFLDSVFTGLKGTKIKNLIVDVRYNGGGTDPNDLVTYSYLTDREFSENKEAWISFHKIPYLQYNSDTNFPYLLKLIGVGKYNKMFRKEFPEEKDGKFYQNASSSDHKIRTPKPNAFTGNIYLLVSPRAASAGSLFAAMVAGNENTIVIGEETMGGYYGHNGHNSLSYKLPKSKIEISFSVVNLDQDVPVKENQQEGRGVIPDYKVTQNYTDYLKQEDAQMNYTFQLIKNK